MLRKFVSPALALALGYALVSPVLAATQLTGAGSTFVYPFFSRAFYDYSQAHADVAVNYQSIGSGGGIEQFAAKTIDFGASDVPMNKEELARAKDPVVQIPVALGGEAVSYNLPVTIKGGLKLTREVLADMYLGKITKWNDAQIAKLNAGASLPDLPIVVAHRSDGSGTTYIFADFLSHASPEWKNKVGVGKSVQWPAQNSVGGKGNEGVAGVVRQTPGAIGYLELAYVVENKIPAALLRNAAGTYVACTASTVQVAAATKANVTASDFSIVDAKAAHAYPIAGYTWAMLYAEPRDKVRGKLIRDVFLWTVTDGQTLAGSLNYVPLPGSVQETAKRGLRQVKV
ncbi:MAG: phosphate ABC transporter substrate-binding protein PstS [Candidatus Velthaea sp.]